MIEGTNPSAPGSAMPFFQISRDDLQTLEEIVPELLARLYSGNSVDNAKIRRVQRILTDVRWRYGPWNEVQRIEAGEQP